MARYLTRNQASLYLGSLLLTGQTTDTAGNVFTIEAQADGADWGSAEPIQVAVQRWMTDGAIASTQGYENRQIAFQVKLSANTSLALAMAEDALVTAARAALSLTWVPPEGSAFAATTVFDVWTCYLAHRFELDEENRLTRTYAVTATAKPWARSATPVTVDAIPTATAGSTTVSVDAGTATTGWAGFLQKTNTSEVSASLSVFSATAVRQSYTVISGDTGYLKNVYLRQVRTGSVTGLATTPYLVIDHRPTGTWSTITVKADGQACGYVGAVGTARYFRVPVGMTSFTTLDILTVFPTQQSALVGSTLIVDLYDVTRTSIGPITSSHRMLNRTIDVGGSVPTSGSIQVTSPSATVLGSTLVYSAPSRFLYSPPLRQYRASGGTVTADATMVSGAREIMSNQTAVYTIPAGALRPATYVVVARFPFSAAGSMNVTFQSDLPGTATRADALPTQAITTTGAATVWAVLGALSLPPVAQPPESAVATSVRLICGTGSASTLLDEIFLLDVTHGAFSLVTSVSPATFTRLWLDSPDVDFSDNKPHIYFGANADRSDAVQVPYSQIIAVGDHDLDPDGSMLFTVTDNVDDAVVTGSFYRRWHTHAAA